MKQRQQTNQNSLQKKRSSLINPWNLNFETHTFSPFSSIVSTIRIEQRCSLKKKKKKRTEQKITLHQWSPRREIGKLTGKPDRGKLSNPRIQTSFPCVKRSTVGDSQSSNRAVEKKSSRLHYDKKIVANNRVDARETREGERNCPGIRKVVRNEEERKSRRRKRRRRMRD